MMNPILCIQNLSTSIKNQLIIKDIDLNLYPGEILGLIGFSGSGKSTLAQSILKLLPPSLHPIYQGKVLFRGINLYEANIRDFRGKKIGMIFQDPRSSLNPSIKVGKQVLESLYAHAFLTKNEALARLNELFAELGLPSETIHRYPHELSGGMNQRVLIANALILKPEVLIADEPTASLDPERSFEILSLFKRYKEKGISTILISHDLHQLIQLSDRIAVMHQGKIIEIGKKESICAYPKHPLTQKLMEVVLNETLF